MEMENGGMQTRSIDQMIAEISDTVQEASGMPFTGGKCLVDRERVLDLLEEIRVNLPDELRQAANVINAKNDIIESAKTEADNIVKAAQAKALALVDADAITVEANRRAKDILTDANDQAANLLTSAQTKAKEMVNTAETRSAEIRKSTGEYLESAMQKTVDVMTAGLTDIKKVQQQMRSVSSKA